LGHEVAFGVKRESALKSPEGDQQRADHQKRKQIHRPIPAANRPLGQGWHPHFYHENPATYRSSNIWTLRAKNKFLRKFFQMALLI
jgi:hypothetical protein